MASAAGTSGANASLADPLLASAKKPVGAKGKYWEAADKEAWRRAKESGGEDGRPLLFRTYKVKGALLHTYRYMMRWVLVLLTGKIMLMVSV
jgi:hypothetical protein